MWEVGVGMAVESNGEKMGTTVIEQQLKKKTPRQVLNFLRVPHLMFPTYLCTRPSDFQVSVNHFF